MRHTKRLANPQMPVVSPPERDHSREVLKYLEPVLSSGNKTGRIYYRAICQPGAPEYPLVFPPYRLSDLQSLGQSWPIFGTCFRRDRNFSVKEDKSGIVRIRIGDVPDTVLRTRIPSSSSAGLANIMRGLRLEISRVRWKYKCLWSHIKLFFPKRLLAFTLGVHQKEFRMCRLSFPM